MSNELATTAPSQSSADALLQIINSGISPEIAGKSLDVFERMQKIDAERAFNAAFVALQSQTPEIVASTIIPNRGKYERFEDVMHVLRPILARNGFAVGFEQSADDKRITVTCHLRHVGGHSTATPFAVRVSGKADSETQADCKASTTAKRNALLQALNIVIRQDCLDSEHDAGIEGGPITAAQAEELSRRCFATKTDPAKFLAFAGAKGFDTIAEGKFAVLDAMLKKKEATQAKPADDLGAERKW